ncbi:helix-turn-helix domain-containing protein [Paraburkholderia atlantica]|uniref:helix-turn-helix domain-containing protein n=1 Tax=Paraburkholderia atlantica TaxID=2654982 RepID=UPI00035DF819|nr:helix-turn-helix domain-containing protein [Paraburkholderia atlantica]
MLDDCVIQRLHAYRFELVPTGVLLHFMRRIAGASRFVDNKRLALQVERSEDSEKKLGYAGMCRRLAAWRHKLETA